MDGWKELRRLEGRMNRLTGLLGGGGVRRVEGKVSKLMEAMVEIERDADKVGVRVMATFAFLGGGSKMGDQGPV